MLAMNTLPLQELFITEDAQTLNELRADIAAGHYRFVSPGLADWIARNADQPTPSHGWMLTVPDKEGTWLLDFHMAPEPIPGASKDGIHAWLNRFNPRNAAEWAAALFCYQRYIFDAEAEPDWATLSFPPDPLLDEITRDTRGLLLWRVQREKVISTVIGIDDFSAHSLQKKWVRNHSNTTFGFNLKDGMLLIGILQKRTLAGRYLGGVGDVPLARLCHNLAQERLGENSA